jgi:hypothetical protein
MPEGKIFPEHTVFLIASPTLFHEYGWINIREIRINFKKLSKKTLALITVTGTGTRVIKGEKINPTFQFLFILVHVLDPIGSSVRETPSTLASPLARNIHGFGFLIASIVHGYINPGTKIF